MLVVPTPKILDNIIHPPRSALPEPIYPHIPPRQPQLSRPYVPHILIPDVVKQE